MKRLALVLSILLLAASSFAVPLSGDYVRIKKTDTSPVEITGYGVLRTLADGRTFIDTGTSSGTLNAPNPDVITVGPMGDSTTISGAITLATGRTPSATNRVTIMVYPGVYAEQSLELPDYVDLIGVSREGCIIEAVGDYEDPNGNAAASALLFVPFNSTVENLTISNTYAGGYSTAVTLAAYIDDATGNLASGTGDYHPTMRNCTVKSASTFACCVLYDSYALVEDCTITGGMYALQATATTRTKHFRRLEVTSTFTAGVDESPLWLGHTGSMVFSDSRFTAIDPTEGGCFVDANLTDGLHLTFEGCTFISGTANAAGPVMTGNPKAGALNVNIALKNCIYSVKGSSDPVITWAVENMGDGAKTFGGPVTVCGFASVGAVSGNVSTVAGYAASGAELTGALIYDTGPDVFAAEGLGLVTIDADGTPEIGYLFRQVNTNLWKSNMPIDAAGLSTTATQWRYFDAVTHAKGEVGPVEFGWLTSTGLIWMPDSATAPGYLYTVTDAKSITFPVPYEPGSVITRISVRWQGVAANDGVIFTIQKRQGGTTAAAWATVGAAQTVTGASETNTVYDVADETMAAGYEYRVMVESQIGTTEARLWELGIETSKRAY